MFKCPLANDYPGDYWVYIYYSDSFEGEVLEPFDLKFQVYDVHEDCTTLELGKKEIPGYNPSVGLGYYEFTQAEYISLKAKVMLMNQVCTVQA